MSCSPPDTPVQTWLGIGDAYSKLVTKGDYSGIKVLYDGANTMAPGGDNVYAMYNATQCTDVRWPQSWRKWRRDNWRTYRKAPFETWANAWGNAPCLYWPAKPDHPVHVTGRRVHVPVLLIDETYDAATPFEGSLEVRSRFPTSSLIEGVNGSTHGSSLMGNACVDNKVAAYLANGTTPPA